MSESIREPAEFEVSPEGVVAAIEAEIQECGGADRYIKSLQLEPAYDPALNRISEVAAIIDSFGNDEFYMQNSTIGDAFYRGAMLGADIACRVLPNNMIPGLVEELDYVFKGIVAESTCPDDEGDNEYVKDSILGISEYLIDEVRPYIDLLKQYEEELFIDSSYYNYGHSGMAMVLLAMLRVISKIEDARYIDAEVAKFATSLEGELEKLFKDSGPAE